MNEFFNIVILMLMLLNPFLLVVYLNDIMQKRSQKDFSYFVGMAGLISALVFVVFAIAGDVIFRRLLQAEFSSFRIFGGIIFLLIALKFIFSGGVTVMSTLRADSKHIAGNIAMPIMIGPGTIGISVIAGKKLPITAAVAAILIALSTTVLILILLKAIHDFVSRKNESLIEQYVELSGKITAIVLGTYAIDMIMRGIKSWIEILS